MYDEITKMTDLELEELEKLIVKERDKRAKKEMDEALNEMMALIQKWAEKHINFYVYDSDDYRVTIHPDDVYIDRGWI